MVQPIPQVVIVTLGKGRMLELTQGIDLGQQIIMTLDLKMLAHQVLVIILIHLVVVLVSHLIQEPQVEQLVDKTQQLIMKVEVDLMRTDHHIMHFAIL